MVGKKLASASSIDACVRRLVAKKWKRNGRRLNAHIHIYTTVCCTRLQQCSLTTMMKGMRTEGEGEGRGSPLACVLFTTFQFSSVLFTLEIFFLVERITHNKRCDKAAHRKMGKRNTKRDGYRKKWKQIRQAGEENQRIDSSFLYLRPLLRLLPFFSNVLSLTACQKKCFSVAIKMARLKAKIINHKERIRTKILIPRQRSTRTDAQRVWVITRLLLPKRCRRIQQRISIVWQKRCFLFSLLPSTQLFLLFFRLYGVCLCVCLSPIVFVLVLIYVSLLL